MTRRLLWVSWILLASLTLFVQFACSPDRFWPEEPFTVEAWKAAPQHSRYRFVRDLQAQHILDGLTRADVVTKLGSPDYEAPDGSYVTYIVKRRDGQDVFFSMDVIYLLDVRFNESGQVQRVLVRGD